MRDIIFISHANPQDNEFARWLTLRLIREGYPVWCDLVQLKGGEDFWKNIEATIRHRAIKFLYILSRTSNDKDGPLQELAVAKAAAREHQLTDFILPVHIDDLAYDETNIELKRLTTIPFEAGWAKGLQQLLEKLEQDLVQKNPEYTPLAAASWWRTQFSANKGIVSAPEDYLTNWFGIVSLPDEIYFHFFRGKLVPETDKNTSTRAPQPIFNFGNGAITFAKRDEFEPLMTQGLLIPDSHRFRVSDLLQGKHSKNFADSRQSRNAIINLLAQGWHRLIENRGLGIHPMANENWCSYFIKDQVEKDRIDFMGVDGKPAHRQIMGYRMVRTADGLRSRRHWHFGISAKPMVYPTLAFSIRLHVLFSSDGKEIWQSAERLHRARMSQCRNWWNDDWRDRILATMEWLSDGEDVIQVPLAQDVVVEVRKIPLSITSEVSFIEPGQNSKETDTEEEDDSDEADEDLEEE